MTGLFSFSHWPVMPLKRECSMMDFHVVISAGRCTDGLTASFALHYAALAGLRFVGLVVPGDGTDFSFLPALVSQVRRLSLYADMEARTGVELCHVPPALLPAVVQEARDAGAEFVMVHGETLGDQVEPGTNFAAIEAGADILAHPGLLDEKAARYAAERGVALEFTSSPKHALTNAHVAAMALRCGCLLVRGSCARCAEEMTTRSRWPLVVRGADVFGENEGRSNLLELLKKSESFLFRKWMLS